jgi:hypothetical protein
LKEISEEVSMFRVGAFVLIALVLSLAFGCSEKTSEAQVTGVELSFSSCLTFNAMVFIDDTYMGSFSSERPAFISVATGSHALYVKGNIVVVAGDSTYCWTESFSVADGQTTTLDLNCNTGGCPASE